jgi:hypothetical protein
MTDQHAIDLLQPLMRRMFYNLQNIGAVAIVGPEEETIILREPTMGEFQQAARGAGVPEPRSWFHFYHIVFGAEKNADAAE